MGHQYHPLRIPYLLPQFGSVNKPPTHSGTPRICQQLGQQRRCIYKYMHRDIDIHRKVADTCCPIISEAVSMTKGVPAVSLTSFYTASLSSGILYLRVGGGQSIVFSPLHCIFHFSPPYRLTLASETSKKNLVMQSADSSAL